MALCCVRMWIPALSFQNCVFKLEYVEATKPETVQEEQRDEALRAEG